MAGSLSPSFVPHCGERLLGLLAGSTSSRACVRKLPPALARLGRAVGPVSSVDLLWRCSTPSRACVGELPPALARLGRVVGPVSGVDLLWRWSTQSRVCVRKLTPTLARLCRAVGPVSGLMRRCRFVVALVDSIQGLRSQAPSSPG